MSRKAADGADLGRIRTDCFAKLIRLYHPSVPCLPVAPFNNVVYQNRAFAV